MFSIVLVYKSYWHLSSLWQDVFKGLEDDADEDLEISQMVEEYTNQGGTILGDLIRILGNLIWVLQKNTHSFRFF